MCNYFVPPRPILLKASLACITPSLIPTSSHCFALLSYNERAVAMSWSIYDSQWFRVQSKPLEARSIHERPHLTQHPEIKQNNARYLITDFSAVLVPRTEPPLARQGCLLCVFNHPIGLTCPCFCLVSDFGRGRTTHNELREVIHQLCSCRDCEDHWSPGISRTYPDNDPRC